MASALHSHTLAHAKPVTVDITSKLSCICPSETPLTSAHLHAKVLKLSPPLPTSNDTFSQQKSFQASWLLYQTSTDFFLAHSNVTSKVEWPPKRLGTMCTDQWLFGWLLVVIGVVTTYVDFQFLSSAVTFRTMTALETFLAMVRQVLWEIILSREWFVTYLTNVHPCCRRPLCSLFHGGMRSPFLSTQYKDKDESISCNWCQVGRRVHYKLVVRRGSAQRRQPNVCIHNKARRFHCVFCKTNQLMSLCFIPCSAWSITMTPPYCFVFCTQWVNAPFIVDR